MRDINLNLTRKQKNEQKEYLSRRVLDFPSSLPTEVISRHAEENRVLPPGTPRPGPLDLTYTPYLVEPMDNMSPQSVIQQTKILKGAQLGFTMMAECVICYYIGYDPSDQLFMSASEGGLEKWASKRLEPAISSYGYRHLIKANENTSGRRQGDKQFSKEYLGMRLDMVSAQAASAMRSDSKKVLIRDEVDGAPAKLKTGEGNWLDVSFARTNAWGNRRKVLDFSTPTTYEESLMYKEYLKGDQRKFYVPCPHCKEHQTLEFKNLVPERSDGQITSVFYACIHCGEAIYNYHKDEMLKIDFENPEKGAHWRATAKPISKTIRSYHINSLYSPVGMLTWKEIYDIYDSAINSNDPDDMRSFTNLYLGLPYKEIGQKPKLQKIIENRGTYKEGEVPDNVLYITIGIDVQRGSKKDDKNPPRLELEVLGHGPGYRTYSILYKRIEGDVDDPFDGAWELLNQWSEETDLKFKKKNGKELNVSLVFIDSGDGTLTEVVYRFCGRWNSTYPIKGYRKSGEDAGLDKTSANDYRRYRLSKINEDTYIYIISTNHYKNVVYSNLKIERKEEHLIEPPGYCMFTSDRPDKYFEMLTAEEKKSDGNFYCPSGKRNEALDCRVYALCAGDVYLAQLVDNLRKSYKSKGAKDSELAQINSRTIIEILKTKQGVTD